MASRFSPAVFSSLPVTPFDGSVYRIVVERLREKILSTEGNRYFPGRYHLVGETGILYTSMDEKVAIEELSRHAARRMLQEKLASGKINLRLRNVLDLTPLSTLRKLGITPEDLVSSDWLIPQALSVQARKVGLQGLIVPSATGLGRNVVVFENNLGAGCLIEVESIRLL
jgi:RES domain-containing protein